MAPWRGVEPAASIRVAGWRATGGLKETGVELDGGSGAVGLAVRPIYWHEP